MELAFAYVLLCGLSEVAQASSHEERVTAERIWDGAYHSILPRDQFVGQVDDELRAVPCTERHCYSDVAEMLVWYEGGCKEQVMGWVRCDYCHITEQQALFLASDGALGKPLEHWQKVNVNDVRRDACRELKRRMHRRKPEVIGYPTMIVEEQ